MADFEKGSLTRLSLSSEGRLTLAPVAERDFRSVGDVSVGRRARFQGQSLRRRRRIGRLQGEAVHGGSGGQNRRRSPSSTAWRSRPSPSTARTACMRPRRRTAKSIAWTRPAKSEVFYDPHAKYIWALAFSKIGRSVRRHRRSGRDSSRDAGRRGLGVLQDRRDARAIAGDGSRTTI